MINNRHFFLIKCNQMVTCYYSRNVFESGASKFNLLSLSEDKFYFYVLRHNLDPVQGHGPFTLGGRIRVVPIQTK